MPSTMSRTATREERIERWVTLDVAGLLLSHVSGLLEDNSLRASSPAEFRDGEYPELTTALGDDDMILDASLFSELWPDEMTPTESPESAEAGLASLRSRVLVGRVLLALSQHPEKLQRLGMEQLAYASRDLRELAASRPDEATWVVPR